MQQNLIINISSFVITLGALFFAAFTGFRVGRKKRVNTYKEVNTPGGLKVTVINPDSDNTLECLGATEARIIELEEFTEKEAELMQKKGGISVAEIIANVSKEAKHPNELAIIAFLIGHNHGITVERERDPLRKLFSRMGHGED